MTGAEPEPEDAFKVVFQRALREARAKTTQRAIAHRVHVAESTLAEWKSVPGRKPRTLAVVQALEGALRRAGADLAENELVDAWQSESALPTPLTRTPSSGIEDMADADGTSRINDVLPSESADEPLARVNTADGDTAAGRGSTYGGSRLPLSDAGAAPLSRRRWLVLAVGVGAITAVIVRVLAAGPADDDSSKGPVVSNTPPSPTAVAKVGDVIYKVTNAAGEGARPLQIAPGDAVEQRFVSYLEVLTSVSVVIGRDMTPMTDADQLPVGRIRIEITDSSGATVAAQEGEALNNINTTFLLQPSVRGEAFQAYVLRVINLSSVTLGFYIAPSPDGYDQAVEIHEDGGRGVIVGVTAMSLTGEISAEPDVG